MFSIKVFEGVDFVFEFATDNKAKALEIFQEKVEMFPNCCIEFSHEGVM